jgi:hypothetical protein
MAGNPRFVLYLSLGAFFYIYIEKSEGINGGIQPTPMGLEQDSQRCDTGLKRGFDSWAGVNPALPDSEQKSAVVS